MSDHEVVVVTGATGLVGRRLLPVLRGSGRSVRILTRRPEPVATTASDGYGRVLWNGLTPPARALENARAVVHLAGEPVFAGRLTRARQEAIRASRVDSTTRFVDAFAQAPVDDRPRVLICASAVGFYGSRGEEFLDEDSPAGEGFLAEVCRSWEEQASAAQKLGVRTISLRIGIVLAREGGALPRMAIPFRLGIGGTLGDGRQWVPWIHIDDLVRLIVALLDEDSVQGPVNAVSPNPVRNSELTRLLARQLHRPAFLRVPAFLLRTALGELADELLGSRRVVAKRAEGMGFVFETPLLADALARELAPSA